MGIASISMLSSGIGSGSQSPPDILFTGVRVVCVCGADKDKGIDGSLYKFKRAHI